SRSTICERASSWRAGIVEFVIRKARMRDVFAGTGEVHGGAVWSGSSGRGVLTDRPSDSQLAFYGPSAGTGAAVRSYAQGETMRAGKAEKVLRVLGLACGALLLVACGRTELEDSGVDAGADARASVDAAPRADANSDEDAAPSRDAL